LLVDAIAKVFFFILPAKNDFRPDITASLKAQIINALLGTGKLSKGIYVLTQDVVSVEDEEEIDALEGDEVEAFEDTPAADTILGVDVFPVIHTKTKQKIFVSAEDIKEVDIGDLL